MNDWGRGSFRDLKAFFRSVRTSSGNGREEVDLFKKERYKTSLQFQIANLTDKTGLYNFLSVFSGTHVTPPRTYSGRVVVHF